MLQTNKLNYALLARIYHVSLLLLSQIEIVRHIIIIIMRLKNICCLSCMELATWLWWEHGWIFDPNHLADGLYGSHQACLLRFTITRGSIMQIKMSQNTYNLKWYNVISFHPQFPDVQVVTSLSMWLCAAHKHSHPSCKISTAFNFGLNLYN